MERIIMNDLLRWKQSKNRKPLLLKGVRQVGKTWALKEFGRMHYINTAYFNFDEQLEYKQFFETTKDIDRILQNLMMASSQRIVPEDTLVIFDEIQECPEALNALKYFDENAPTYHVVCASSLLGVTLSKPASFPVGKVDFLEIGPMSFSEFLLADGAANYASYLKNIERFEPIPEAFYNPIYEKLKMFFVTGGMPESVRSWTEDRDVERVQYILSNILDAYVRDFAKHPDRKDYPKLSMLWHSIPSQLARENKKFLYKVVKEGARAREYEDALQWLCDAGLALKVYRSSAPGLPMSAYDDLSAFKLYLVDIGLLRRLSLLNPSAIAEGNRLFVEFKGALSENYVLQSLKPQFEAMPRYWAVDNPRHEIDFLVQRDNDIFPIEVKSERNVTSRSLQKYKEKYKDDVKLRVRLSLQNLRMDGDLLNIPLFLADETDRLIGLSLEIL
ncbi:MAG: ATP-binding protein [Firmicutes bacterium]|nr:ATP-binding protein [Bacillota bacterium]